jgi:hypothetical protein
MTRGDLLDAFVSQKRLPSSPAKNRFSQAW